MNLSRTTRKALITAFLVVALICSTALSAQTVGEASISWNAKSGNAATLTVSGPADYQFRTNFAQGEQPSFGVFHKTGQSLPDGVYTWELTYNPVLSAEQQAALAANRDQAPSAKADRQSGYLSVLNGRFVSPEATEEAADKATGEGLAKAQVFTTDLIVQGSGCIGFDCTTSESFGSDTFRLKENNLRIHFDDTSSSANFPGNDWRIVANDSTNGGANYFRVEDATAGRSPFTIEAGAQVNTLYVEDDGDVGIKTANPVVDLHVVEGNSPTLRLEQDGSDGFASQTWDLAGNEANFFIRDVTNSSKLPFRIKPSAPTDSMYIDNDGEVGFGTDNPQDRLDVRGTTTSNPGIRLVNPNVNTDGWAFRVVNINEFRISEQSTGVTELSLDASGNLSVLGTISSGGTQLNVPDYVFEDDYDLMSLADLRSFVEENKHLPRIPSANEINGSGTLNMTDMQMRLLEKVEELTLYTLAQDETITELKARLAALEGGE